MGIVKNDTTQSGPATEAGTSGDKSSQRGATLTGYAMALTLLVVMALGSIAALEQSSEDFLTESGTSIGSPRASSVEAARSQLDGLSTQGNSLGVLPGP